MTFQTLQDRHDEAAPPGGGRPEHRKVIKQIPDVLDVVTVVYNPIRYRTRYDLFRAFEAHVQESGARLTVVEVAFGNRPFEVTTHDNPRHVQLRTAHEFWTKESALNLGIARLPRDARYVAWVDADIHFLRHDWAQETIQQLQHYSIVQLFSEAHDLDPDGMVMTSFRSFAWSHIHGIPRKRRGQSSPVVNPHSDYYGPGMDGRGNNSRIGYWHHPGFAWAARKEALETVGGLFDVAVVGEADYMMAKSLFGEVTDMLYPGVSPGYRKSALDWQREALKLRGNLGYVPGTITHGWHGKKALRKYWDRCKILTDTQFDPTVDLKRDWQGLYQLVDDGTPRSILLRDSIRSYFRSRNEDGTEL